MPDQPPPPSVDFVIAVHNEEKMLGSCIESILAQQYPEDRLRVIVVDNASTDATRLVAARYPVEVLAQSKPGPAAARNVGIAAGNGELVAFLDGHCILGPGWIGAMTDRFKDARVGGCQAFTDLRAIDSRVSGHIELNGMNEHEALLDATVRAERNIFPWMLSGNCMYTRRALVETGGFDESLPSCEDVDLSWRAVLSGYLLDYADGARTVHWNCDTWDAYVRKSRHQGRGSAVLASRYLRLGASNDFAPVVFHGGGDRALIAAGYEAGYREEEKTIAAQRYAETSFRVPCIRADFRQPFEWSAGTWLRIPEEVVYWFQEDRRSVIVHHPTRSRLVLEDTAHLIWRGLSAAQPRESLAADIAGRYRVSADTILDDCEEFIDELVRSEVLSVARPAWGATA